MTVYALGGSIFSENIDNLNEYKKAFEDKEQNIIVTGAGELKKNILAAENLANQTELDLIGIKATRLNAQTLSTVIDSYPNIPNSIEEFREAYLSEKNIVMGGLVPGYSTDAVAATLAEITDSKLVIATSVKGVYNKDPELEGSKKLDEISIEKLRELTQGNNSAGSHELIDSTALDIIERSSIPTEVKLGTPKNLLENIHDGTTIIHK